MLPILNESLCDRCIAICCQYITLEIDKPRSKRSYDDIRWYLLHEGITLLIENDRWMVKVPTRCTKLSADNKCTIYETRPHTCREYSTENCDYHTEYEGWDTEYVEIETPEDLELYLEKRRQKRGAKKSAKTNSKSNSKRSSKNHKSA